MFDYIFCDQGCIYFKFWGGDVFKAKPPFTCCKYNQEVFIRDGIPMRCAECKKEKERQAKEKAEKFVNQYRAETDAIKKKRAERKRERRKRKGGSQWL